MRHLYTEFYKKDRNYSPKEFQQVCEIMAGSSLEDFFSRYVRGREELDYNSALGAAGLVLNTNASALTGKPAERAYLGADVAQDGERLLVRRVYAGSPAYEQGLNTGDQIVALNNMRVNKDFFDSRIAEKRPGELINLTIFRSDDLSMLPIKLGGRIPPAFAIVPLPKPTEEQKRIYQSWIGTPAGK